jgi:hypothetical protein
MIEDFMTCVYKTSKTGGHGRQVGDVVRHVPASGPVAALSSLPLFVGVSKFVRWLISPLRMDDDIIVDSRFLGPRTAGLVTQ